MMKFLRNNLKVIIGFIVGVILASGITVYAYSYYARDIGYIKPGIGKEISVEKALNELYSKDSTKEVVFVAQYTNYLSGYMFDLSSGTFTPANSQDVTGETMKIEWNGNAYVVKAMVDGRFLLSWNYDSNIVECNVGDTIYTFNRQNDSIFTSIGLIK